MTPRTLPLVTPPASLATPFSYRSLPASLAAAGTAWTPRLPMGPALVRARAALLALVRGARRFTDPVADCVREAAAVRREALRLMAQNPAMAADLYAAADRHEREHGAGR